MLNETTPPQRPASLRVWIGNVFRHVADALAPCAVERTTIGAIKEELAYGVEVALLSAEEAEERAVFTTLMLRQRLRRLNDEDHIPAGVPASTGSGAAQAVRRGVEHHCGVSLPAGGPALAEPEVALRKEAGRTLRTVRQQGDGAAAVVRGSSGGDQR